MKTSITLAAIAALTGSGFAQMATLPPASTSNGISIQSIGLNAGVTHWDSPAGISAFKAAGLTEGTNLINTLAYNPSGLSFGSALPASIQSALDTINANGGTIRTVFLSESAGWRNSLGYTYSGAYAGPQSYTAFADMADSATPQDGPASISFGTYFDVSLQAGVASKFDLWFQGEDATYGGDYTLFNPANSSNTSAPGNALWAQQALTTSTWSVLLNKYVDVSTYVVGLEDWRLNAGSDSDYSDAVIALQFFALDGTPIEGTVVPEPSTYGLIGAAALLGLVAIRRRTRKNQKSV